MVHSPYVGESCLYNKYINIELDKTIINNIGLFEEMLFYFMFKRNINEEKYVDQDFRLLAISNSASVLSLASCNVTPGCKSTNVILPAFRSMSNTARSVIT